jgi:hypothetical protein
MKLTFCDPHFLLFASDVLAEEDDDEPTRPGDTSSPPVPDLFREVRDFTSEVRIRCAVRAEKVAQRRRGA